MSSGKKKMVVSIGETFMTTFESVSVALNVRHKICLAHILVTSMVQRFER